MVYFLSSENSAYLYIQSFLSLLKCLKLKIIHKAMKNILNPIHCPYGGTSEGANSFHFYSHFFLSSSLVQCAKNGLWHQKDLGSKPESVIFLAVTWAR